MDINLYISKAYIVSNKKLTGVAVFGVLLGMAIFIFMNSMMVGFDKSSNVAVFKSNAHIRIYKDDEISKPIAANNNSVPIIINPKVVPTVNTIINPNMIIETVKKIPEVLIATPQVMSNVFYNSGKSQISGMATGIKYEEADAMFSISSTMVEGSLDLLQSNPSGIIIGSGIASKMNLTLNDNINITSSKGINKTFKIVGVFKTNNSVVDKTKSYINIASAQQLLKQGSSYITDINVNITDPNNSAQIASQIQTLTGYKAEGWQQANETLMATQKMRKMIITFVSLTILLVAGFGIYNILNMTVSQKINEIAILKAIGFKGKDVVKIFVVQALTIGVLGVVGGVLMSTLLITLLKKVYLGGDLGYFPIDYEPVKYLQGIIIGLLITFFAGYIPARKAALVDPVDIFRK
jgi:lipoprotein-releasing system permease protein